MATVDRTGVRGRTLDSYIRLLKDRFRTAFGQDLALEAETPQSQIVGIMASALAENDEAIVGIGNAMSIDTAAGLQLDDIGSLLSVQRMDATRSTATLSLTGVAGTAVRAGSTAQTEAGVRWRTLSDVVLAIGGSSVEAEAVEPGPTEAAAGAINSISPAVPGWETVTNPAAALPGRAAETDSDYRARFESRVGRNSRAPLDALRAALVEAGAGGRLDARQNAADAETVLHGYRIPAHSVAVVVRDGGDGAISAAVAAAKGLGVGAVAAIEGGAHSDLAAIKAVASGTFDWLGESVSGIDLSGATDLANAASLAQAAIRAELPEASIQHQWGSNGRFVLSYPWRPDVNVALPTGTAAAAMGLAAGTRSAGPFLRARARALTLAATVKAEAGFPADGLDMLRRAASATADALPNAVAPRLNQFIAALEDVPGAAVTALALTDKPSGTDATAAVVPLDGYYALSGADISITLA